MRRLIFPILMGLVGCAILVSLGIWQVQRLHWKQGVLDAIEARIGGAPEALPTGDVTDPAVRDSLRYTPVRAEGMIDAGEIHVLTTVKDEGPGFRLIVPFETGGRRILADLGYISEEAKKATRSAMPATIEGNLHWPRESDRWTPAPDMGANIWFARDVPAMAAHLKTEPLLIIARHIEGGPDTLPQPVTTSGIPNDHLSYAATWFGLALIWAIMSLYLIRRTLTEERRRT